MPILAVITTQEPMMTTDSDSENNQTTVTPGIHCSLELGLIFIVSTIRMLLKGIVQ